MTNSQLDEIIQGQGWNESSVLSLLVDFLNEYSMLDAAAEFLKQKAKEENEEE